MKAIIERSKYNPEVKKFNRWTNASPLNRFPRDGETDEEFRASCEAAAREDFYAAIDWLLAQGYDEYHELVSRTICLSSNGFKAAREYRVKRNGHYKLVGIYICVLGGCCITERDF
ncbi:hypothetical protein LJC74_06890 [Eubacteriales bacterium OttesenSCG-928-A19]|nr:hypothetical protein [Eubacteriales bacterium OttesenSCG-928-A19]